MQLKLNKMKIVLGNCNLKKPKLGNIFDNNIIDMFRELSKHILNSKECKKFPDLIFFGFWCRKSNLENLKKKYINQNNRLGRGLLFHVTPSNVPTNFIYSMVFGLLSGNSNVIRLPSKNYIQIQILCKILKKVFLKKKYKKISERVLLIKYEKSDNISAELSKIADGRVLWGSDETVINFKTFFTKPRSVDVIFPNRYSISIINSDQLSNLSQLEIYNLALKFYNDAYTMDQFGCSSPNTVFWLGKNNKKIKIFWEQLKKIVNSKYSFNLSEANKKMSKLMEFTFNEKNTIKLKIDNFNLVRLNHEKINLPKYKNIGFGTFVEIKLKNIDSIKKYCSKELQTITQFGLSSDLIKKMILKNNIKGIDRIVPLGRAFDLGLEWDGIDVIYSLSRTISF